MQEGKVSSKFQLTLPTKVRKALNIKPGDVVRYELEGGSVRLSVVRPDVNAVLDGVLDEFDFHALREVTGNDAVAYVHGERGLDD